MLETRIYIFLNCTANAAVEEKRELNSKLFLYTSKLYTS
jgi:hypothetical protein